MRTVHVTRIIPAPPESVFDLLADHANYDRFRPIGGSDLLRRAATKWGGSPATHQGPAPELR
jgi:uncharacterized protein YndB with AHSA1/START domain